MITKTNLVKEVIVKLYEQLINEHCPLYRLDKNQGILFKVNIQGRHSGYEKETTEFHSVWEKHVTETVEIIILYGRRVYLRVDDNTETPEMYTENFSNTKNWINTSNHPSCWKHDGFSDLDDSFKRVWRESQSNAPVKEHGSFNEVIDVEFGNLFTLFTLVEVKRNMVADNDIINKIKTLPFNIVLQ